MHLARAVAAFAADKKADDIVILDMRKVANFCDYFVVSSGNSQRQVKAITQGIAEGLRGLGMNPQRTEGLRDARWVIVDLGTVVAHVFDAGTREFYGLEYLWQDARRVSGEPG